MNRPSFPFFAPVDQRSLTPEERAVVECVITEAAPELLAALPDLRVVGRCGCEACPTVFFQSHEPSESEHEVASYAGKDESGGVVGVVLWEKHGKPSQLEFYSADGHDPWHIPSATTLEAF